MDGARHDTVRASLGTAQPHGQPWAELLQLSGVRALGGTRPRLGGASGEMERTAPKTGELNDRLRTTGQNRGHAPDARAAEADEPPDLGV